MRVAVLSDIHDHVWNLQAALPACAPARELICCGDLCSPFIVNLLAQGFPGPIHIVFGNNDGDHFRMTQNAAKYDGRVVMHGEFADLPAAYLGKRIAVNHFPPIAEGIAAGAKYDIVCYGHDHTLSVRRAGSAGAVVLNPGTLMGYDPAGAGVDVPATFCLLDTDTMEVGVYSVDARLAQPVEQLEVRKP